MLSSQTAFSSMESRLGLPGRPGMFLGLLLASLLLILEVGVSAACGGTEMPPESTPTAQAEAPAAQAEAPAAELRRLTVRVQFVGMSGVAPGPGLPEPRPVMLGAGVGATVQLFDPATPGQPLQTMVADDQGNAVFLLPAGSWRVVVPEGRQGSALAGATLQQTATPSGMPALAWSDVTMTAEVDAEVTLEIVVALV